MAKSSCTASADIDLPNVLLAIFSTVPRERGEIPFAVDQAGKVYAPTDEDRSKVEALGSVARPDGSLGKTVLPEWVVVTTADRPAPGCASASRGRSATPGDSAAPPARNAGFGLLFIAIALVGIVPLSTRLTRNLTTLTDGVSRIAHGDYAARVPVKSADEVGRLAAAFNQMAEDVERHQRPAVEQERIRRELELGRQIQNEMLPHAPLHFGLTEVKGVSVPAREVGGDFFNYFALDPARSRCSSATSRARASARRSSWRTSRRRCAPASLGQELSAIADAIDRDIEANSPGPVYATLFIGIFDPVTRSLRYVNAGHNPQYLLRGDGRLERMSSTGLPVGLLAGRGYAERESSCGRRSALLLYRRLRRGGERGGRDVRRRAPRGSTRVDRCGES